MTIEEINFQDSEKERKLVFIGKLCRLFSFACIVAFLAIAFWTIFVSGLFAFSLTTSSEIGESTPLALITLLLYFLYGINCSLIPFFLNQMLRSIARDETPFTSANVKWLRVIAGCFLLYFVLESLLGYADSHFIFALQNDEIIVDGFIRDFASTAGTTFNLFPVIISAVFIALSCIFEYGVLLQQESDETL